MAHSGIASRRGSDKLVLGGRVSVNGRVTLEPGHEVLPGDAVEIDGKRIALEAAKVVFAFNKPTGVVSTSSDPEGRKTVASYFEELPYRLYTVGRLDFDSEGLIFVTNDGDFANRLTHPKYEVEKEYYAVCKGLLSERDRRKLESGVPLEDGLTAPALVRLINKHGDSTELSIIIREGRNRQVRRMLQAVGHPVKKLRRERIANITLSGLKSGEKRELTREELEKFMF